jgi:leader peptidase (prepilin peptidase)/N-methyltransferase
VYIEQISQFPLAWSLLLIVIGLLIGSFLNVVILRLPRSLEYEWKSQCRELLLEAPPADDAEAPPNIIFPASHCPQCKSTLKWWQNIPVLGYLLLRGKCHSCKKPISLRYPAVEILTAALTLLAGFSFPETQTLPWILILVWLLIAMSVIDFDTQLLPDNLTLPLMWLGLIYSTLPGSPVSPVDSIIGAAAGYTVLWILFQVHYFITKRQGMGYGDFKLLAAAGAWLGWQSLPFVLLIAATSGLLISLALILFRNHDKNRAVPFGPYLAIAFLITLFWGEPLIGQYLSLTGIRP